MPGQRQRHQSDERPGEEHGVHAQRNTERDARVTTKASSAVHRHAERGVHQCGRLARSRPGRDGRAAACRTRRKWSVEPAGPHRPPTLPRPRWLTAVPGSRQRRAPRCPDAAQGKSRRAIPRPRSRPRSRRWHARRAGPASSPDRGRAGLVAVRASASDNAATPAAVALASRATRTGNRPWATRALGPESPDDATGSMSAATSLRRECYPPVVCATTRPAPVWVATDRVPEQTHLGGRCGTMDGR